MAKRKLKKEISDRDLLIHKVAFLSSQGLTQREIGEKLSILDRTKISRLVSKANEKGLITTEYTPRDREIYERVSKLLGGVNLDKAMKEFAEVASMPESMLPKTHMIVARADQKNRNSFEHQIAAFGSECGPVTIQMMRDLEVANKARNKSDKLVVGVSSGRTLRSVVDSLHFEKMQGVNDLSVIPLWGSAYSNQMKAYSKSNVYSDPYALSSTALANDIVRALRRDDQASSECSLQGVPVVIPAKFKGENLEVLREFFETVSSMNQIFDGENALVHSVGMLMISVGSPKHAGRFLSESILGTVMSRKKVRLFLDSIIGDVAGILIPKSDEQSEQNIRDIFGEQYGEHWLGLNTDHLDSLSREARESENRVGVCAYAAGGHRSEIVLEAIRRGYLNHLICDSSLAEQMVKDIRKLERK